MRGLATLGAAALAWWALTRPRRRVPLVPPLDHLKPSSLYGRRRSPTEPGAPLTCHRGLDLPAPTGSPVYAALPGLVLASRETPTGGQSIVLGHGDGIETVYLHLSARHVGEGERVRAGQTIGEVGSTGRSTGPHLHFGVKVDGAFIDPGPLLGLPEGVPCD